MRYFLHQDNVFAASEELLNKNAMIVAITMGSGGCLLHSRRGWVYRPTYNVPVLDTTGAGDSFMGSLIYTLTRDRVNISGLEKEDLTKIADFCNACSSASTMKRGSLLVMPDREQAEKIMHSVPQIRMTLEQAITRNL